MEKVIKKGQIIQHKGDVNTKAYIVKEGLLRSYIIDEKGKEHIFMFAPEEWIIADACTPESPCELFIDALEDTTVSVSEKGNNLQELDTSPLIRRIEVLQKRVLMLMGSTAFERYEHFIHTYPTIIQRVPQRMIASYLGITPEALSRAKKEDYRNP